MYIGSAGLMNPVIQNAKKNQNGIMSVCATGAGAMISIGLGRLASKLLNKAIDKVVDFWDDVKPKDKEEESDNEEAEANG